MRVAYLINQYPKVSHTFIRREILALERQGVEVMRVALRGWDGELADPEDKRERERTRYVLREARMPLLLALLRMLVDAAVAFHARAGAGMAHEPRGRAAAARASDLPGGSVPHRAVAAGGGRPACACALRHKFGGSGDAGARAGRAALELHRARAGGIRQGAADRAGGEGPTRGVRGGDQFLRAQPALPHVHAPSTGLRCKVVPCGLEPAYHSRRCEPAAG